MKFNERLKEARKQAKMTQAQLADKVNVTQGTIANWERGVREPDLDTIKLLAYALDVPPEYFIKNDSLSTADYQISNSESDGGMLMALDKDTFDKSISAISRKIQERIATEETKKEPIPPQSSCKDVVLAKLSDYSTDELEKILEFAEYQHWLKTRQDQ